MMLWQIAKPSPVPTPTGLVVKNGSEDFVFDVIGNAAAGVADFDASTPVGRLVDDDANLVGVGVSFFDRLRRVHQKIFRNT